MNFRNFACCCVFVLVAFSSVAVFAQSDDKDVYVGLKGGVSVPNLVGGGDEEITRDYKSRFTYNFGGFVDVGISKRVSIQTEVNYSPQGGKRDGIQPITAAIPGLPPLPPGSYLFADFKNTAKLKYIEVPVLFKYTWRRDSGPQFYVNAGPNAGFLIKATQETRGTSTIYVDKNGTPLLLPPVGTPIPPMSFDADTDVTDSLHRFNFGLTGGGGVKFPVGKNFFFIDARASYGLTTLQKNTATDGTSRTGNLVMSVGYAFKVR
ncbi:MAG: porin family protein [Pyrinomonadaceae bacterium]